MATKICSKCGIEKDISEFNRHINRKDGLHTECRECRREYRSLHRDGIQKYKMNYRREHGVLPAD